MVNFSNLVVPSATIPASAATAEAPDTTEQTSAVQLQGKAFNQGLQTQAPAAGGASSEDTESDAIKALKQMIKDLQKQLAEAQRQLESISAQQMSDQAKQTAVAAQQANIATINASLMTATSQLLAALAEANKSSAGSMVSTQA
ncbi:hypothetical protein [Pseudomonas phoenicis]|uniref:hypothetical protein n=1 Tax=unclassified Pseudomonas TaxID=196821 RepID=UPI0039A37A8D